MASHPGRNDLPPIIVKKVTVVAEQGHHGGAWKVAYADFVTAMMAFFLLLWLLGSTTEAQRKGLALPGAPSSKQQKELRSLQRASAKDFDQSFLEQMTRDHQKAVDLFGHEVRGRHQDAELKDFAQQTVVKLQRHLSAATILQKDSGHLPG